MYAVQIVLGNFRWLKQLAHGKLMWTDDMGKRTLWKNYEEAAREGMRGIDMLTVLGFSCEAEIIKVRID